MEIDTSEMDEATAMQARMFATMLSSMPMEALEVLLELVAQEIAERG